VDADYGKEGVLFIAGKRRQALVLRGACIVLGTNPIGFVKMMELMVKGPI